VSTAEPQTSLARGVQFSGDAPHAFASLEQLRGLLALYVVIAHSRAILWIGLREATISGIRDTYSGFERFMASFNMLSRFGNEAVIVFFVLSGFSIAHALRWAPNPSRFFFRRFLRLYPVKFAGICWALLVFALAVRLCPELLHMDTPYGLNMRFASPVVILKNISYMPEGELVRPLWSLPHEMFFYLLAPFLAPRPRAFLLVSFVTWAVGVFGVYTLALTLSPTALPSFLVQFVFHYMVLFALGIVLYAHYDTIVRWVQTHRKLAAALGIVTALVTLGLQLRFNYAYVNVRDLLTGLLGVGVVMLFIRLRIKSRPLDRLGRQSYSLYVCHMPTIIALSVIMKSVGLTELNEPRPWVWLLAVPACVLVAELLFRSVERPVRTYLERTRKYMSPPASLNPISSDHRWTIDPPQHR
jgi:peptidoglycan/LPS O-acetylase OafA/YrhL